MVRDQLNSWACLFEFAKCSDVGASHLTIGLAFAILHVQEKINWDPGFNHFIQNCHSTDWVVWKQDRYRGPKLSASISLPSSAEKFGHADVTHHHTQVTWQDRAKGDIWHIHSLTRSGTPSCPKLATPAITLKHLWCECGLATPAITLNMLLCVWGGGACYAEDGSLLKIWKLNVQVSTDSVDTWNDHFSVYCYMCLTCRCLKEIILTVSLTHDQEAHGPYPSACGTCHMT